MHEEVPTKMRKGVALAASLCAMSVVSTMFTGIAFVGANFPTVAGWAFGVSIASLAAAFLMGLGIAALGAIERKD